MAHVQNAREVTLAAGADLSAVELYTAVEIDNTGRVVAATTAGDEAIGVLLSQPDAAGKDVLVGAFPGSTIVKVKAGAAFQEGVNLMVEGTTGRFITATSGNVALLTALDPGVDGEIVRAFVGPTFIVPA